MSEATASTIASPMSAGSGGGGLEIDADPRVDGTQTSQLPHGPDEGLAEVCGHLLVAAHARLRERDDSVGTRLGNEARAVEKRFDSFARIGGSGREVDSHQPPLVEAPLEEACLLEHADEDTRIAFRHEDREVVGVDEPVRVSQRTVDRSELRRRRHVGDREAPERGCVARAREQERLARLAVPSGAPDHLDVPLERVRVVDEADEPHVRLVDAHAERRRGDDRLCLSGHEGVLNPRAFLCFEARVVVLGSESMTAEDTRELLGRASRAGVDDRGAAA